MLKFKALGVAFVLVLIVGLAAVASGVTSAYFSDTHSGAITGTAGTIGVAAGVNPDFGGGLAFAWSNILPGEVKSAVVHYTNNGTGPEDLWIVFPNATALSALNNLGRYGAVKITDSNTGVVFYSDNLNDHPDDPLVELPPMVKLVSNLPVGATGTMTFEFQYAPKLTSGNGTGFPFNTYPVAGQTTVVASDGTGAGLPYAIVGTQVGILPGAVGAYAGF